MLEVAAVGQAREVARVVQSGRQLRDAAADHGGAGAVLVGGRGHVAVVRGARAGAGAEAERLAGLDDRAGHAVGERPVVRRGRAGEATGGELADDRGDAERPGGFGGHAGLRGVVDDREVPRVGLLEDVDQRQEGLLPVDLPGVFGRLDRRLVAGEDDLGVLAVGLGAREPVLERGLELALVDADLDGPALDRRELERRRDRVRLERDVLALPVHHDGLRHRGHDDLPEGGLHPGGGRLHGRDRHGQRDPAPVEPVVGDAAHGAVEIGQLLALPRQDRVGRDTAVAALERHEPDRAFGGRVVEPARGELAHGLADLVRIGARGDPDLAAAEEGHDPRDRAERLVPGEPEGVRPVEPEPGARGDELGLDIPAVDDNGPGQPRLEFLAQLGFRLGVGQPADIDARDGDPARNVPGAGDEVDRVEDHEEAEREPDGHHGPGDALAQLPRGSFGNGRRRGGFEEFAEEVIGEEIGGHGRPVDGGFRARRGFLRDGRFGRRPFGRRGSCGLIRRLRHAGFGHGGRLVDRGLGRWLGLVRRSGLGSGFFRRCKLGVRDLRRGGIFGGGLLRRLSHLGLGGRRGLGGRLRNRRRSRRQLGVEFVHHLGALAHVVV